MLAELKSCSKCGAAKPHDLAYFKPARGCVNGIGGVCRECANRYLRKWKASQGEEAKAARRSRYAASEKVVEARRVRERWQSDPFRQRGCILAAGVAERSRLGSLPCDALLRSRHYWAERLRAQPRCECCDVVFILEGNALTGIIGPHDRSPTVDRVVPRLGYVEANVALLCWRCNNLKRDATAAELERVAAWMRSREKATDALPNR